MADDRKVRVFISSTFKDMHAERDHLVTVVFPELRERCERLGLEFFDVDLRWGVPEKGADGEKANSWEYCRQWIDRVEPFFICILGQRYGWVPPPENLKSMEDRTRQTADPRSITDMEVRHAVLDSRLKRRSHFYLRAAEAPASATDHVDPPPLLEKLSLLKGEVRACGRPVRDYPCEWSGDHFTGMDIFGRMVLEDLWSGILRDPRFVSRAAWQQVLGADPDSDPRYTDESVPVPDDIAEQLIPLAKPPPKDPLDAERDEMAAFAESRLRWFQGRTKEIDDLTALIRDPAEGNQPRLAVIAAVPGQGKSALMAKLHSALILQSSAFTISHFVGATETSSASYRLVRRLIDELDRSGIAFPEPPQPEGQTKEEPKLDFQSLCQRLSERLRDYDGEKRIVLLLDALNQLDDGHDLGWLPHRLGPGVRIVVSCIDDPSSQDGSPDRKVLTALQARFPKPKFVPLGGLDAADVRTIVEGYLLEYCKQLDAPHVDAICAMPPARNPLYLLVMLAELRTLGGNDMNRAVPELIAGMAGKHPDTVSLFKWVLQRMEAAEGFGAAGTGWWCLYLAIGRVGMASRELSDLLARKLGPGAGATALRIERGLRRYLQRRGETLDVFHGQLRLAVLESYGSEESIREAHRDIADYFLSLADPSQDKQWQGEHQRPFSEIAFHLIGSQQWDELCDYLTDFRCLDRRIRSRQVFQVVTDQRAAIAALPELAEEARLERKRVDVCKRYGDALVAYSRECAEGKHPALPEPPNARETAAAAEATSKERSPRADQLRVIADFAKLHISFIHSSPSEFLCFVANATVNGPLNVAGEIINAQGGPWLHRRNRPPAHRPECLQILRGHTDRVTSVGITFDGRRAVSASSDKSLRVWNLESGECLLTLQGHTGGVTSLSLTPDGRRAVSASSDNTLRVWNLESGECLLTTQGHKEGATSVSLTPDARRAVSTCGKIIRVWDLECGRCVQILTGHTDLVRSVGITPDGRIAVSGSHDSTLRVWNLDSGDCIRTLHGHTDLITAVSLSPDGQRVVSASSDFTMRVWDLSGAESFELPVEHLSYVTCIGVTSDGRRAVSVSTDTTLRVWDLSGGLCLQTIEGRSGVITSVGLTPNGRHAVSGSLDNTVRVWDLIGSQYPTFPREPEPCGIDIVIVTSDGRRAVSGCSDVLRVWDLESGHYTLTLKASLDLFDDLSLSPDGRHAVSIEDEFLGVLDLHRGRRIGTLSGHTDSINSVDLTSDGRLAVSASSDTTLRVWDLVGRQCVKTLQGHTESVTRVKVTPDGRRAISASDDGTLRVWDINSSGCSLTLKGHKSATVVSLTPDGRRAVSACGRTIRVWDLESGDCLHTLAASVSGLTLARDGRLAVSKGGQMDTAVHVWDLISGKCLYTLQGHRKWITSVSVCMDSRFAVSGSADGTLRVWDLASGNCLAIYQAGARVSAVAVSPTDDTIVCGTTDGQMHVLTMRNFP